MNIRQSGAQRGAKGGEGAMQLPPLPPLGPRLSQATYYDFKNFVSLYWALNLQLVSIGANGPCFAGMVPHFWSPVSVNFYCGPLFHRFWNIGTYLIFTLLVLL